MVDKGSSFPSAILWGFFCMARQGAESASLSANLVHHLTTPTRLPGLYKREENALTANTRKPLSNGQWWLPFWFVGWVTVWLVFFWMPFLCTEPRLCTWTESHSVHQISQCLHFFLPIKESSPTVPKSKGLQFATQSSGAYWTFSNDDFLSQYFTMKMIPLCSKKSP